MQASSRDAEIRASAAFPLVVRAARLRTRLFWGGLLLFGIVAFCREDLGNTWSFVIAIPLYLAGVAVQVHYLRQARLPLLQISDDSAVQARATKLAADDAKPRLLRWLPGPPEEFDS